MTLGAPVGCFCLRAFFWRPSNRAPAPDLEGVSVPLYCSAHTPGAALLVFTNQSRTGCPWGTFSFCRGRGGFFFCCCNVCFAPLDTGAGKPAASGSEHIRSAVSLVLESPPPPPLGSKPSKPKLEINTKKQHRRLTRSHHPMNGAWI